MKVAASSRPLSFDFDRVSEFVEALVRTHRNVFSFRIDAGEQFNSETHCFGQRLCAKGPPDTPFAATEMEREGHPVVANSTPTGVDIQVVRWRGAGDPKGKKNHVACD